MNYRSMGVASLLAVAAATTAHAQSSTLQGHKTMPAVTSTVTPTKQGMAAARALATNPSDTAVPYVDFGPMPTTKPPTTKTATRAHPAKAAAKKPSA